jgi:hypothetical protein
MIAAFIALGGIWVMGAILVFAFHARYLQMVTPGLALLRAVVWPLYLTTGWPRGTPLSMDGDDDDYNDGER